MTLKSADGGDIRVLVTDPNFEHQQGDVLEIIGTMSPENFLECFVTRSMGRDFDLDLYNELITKVMSPTNGQYNEYFFTEIGSQGWIPLILVRWNCRFRGVTCNLHDKSA